jgi:hypothetical protein
MQSKLIIRFLPRQKKNLSPPRSCGDLHVSSCAVSTAIRDVKYWSPVLECVWIVLSSDLFSGFDEQTTDGLCRVFHVLACEGVTDAMPICRESMLLGK